jgi:hypothetical protein
MIATRAAPHLQPGEQIQTGFIAQTRRPIVALLLIAATRVWTIVVTDRAILAVHGGQAHRLPRDVRFGEPAGIYHAIQLDRTYWVHRQYYKELAAADEALRAMRPGGN